MFSNLTNALSPRRRAATRDERVESRWLKSAAYSTGALTAFHSMRNANNLTVVMFHRILPTETDTAFTNPDYVLSTDLFRHCLRFFADHYKPVSLEQVIAAYRSSIPLPSHPLLITFDDGWCDTWEYASPLLSEAHMPAVCFVIGDILAEENQVRWQDAFAFAWRRRLVTEEMVSRAWKQLEFEEIPNAAALSSHSYLRSCAMMYELPSTIRMGLIEKWLANEPYRWRSQMLSVEQCAALRRSGVSIGAHGSSHVALTYHRNPRAELLRARTEIEAAFQDNLLQVQALSFPHGQWTKEIVEEACAAGFVLNFNSLPQLTKLAARKLTTNVCGRIEIATRHIIDGKGLFCPELLALHLFTRPAHS